MLKNSKKNYTRLSRMSDRVFLLSRWSLLKRGGLSKLPSKSVFGRDKVASGDFLKWMFSVPPPLCALAGVSKSNIFFRKKYFPLLRTSQTISPKLPLNKNPPTGTVVQYWNTKYVLLRTKYIVSMMYISHTKGLGLLVLEPDMNDTPPLTRLHHHQQ